MKKKIDGIIVDINNLHLQFNTIFRPTLLNPSILDISKKNSNIKSQNLNKTKESINDSNKSSSSLNNSNKTEKSDNITNSMMFPLSPHNINR